MDQQKLNTWRKERDPVWFGDPTRRHMNVVCFVAVRNRWLLNIFHQDIEIPLRVICTIVPPAAVTQVANWSRGTMVQSIIHILMTKKSKNKNTQYQKHTHTHSWSYSAVLGLIQMGEEWFVGIKYRDLVPIIIIQWGTCLLVG